MSKPKPDATYSLWHTYFNWDNEAQSGKLKSVAKWNFREPPQPPYTEANGTYVFVRDDGVTESGYYQAAIASKCRAGFRVAR